MRAVSACLLFAVAAAVVSAQTCTAPSSDPFNPTAASSCNLIQTCQTNLCACTGSNASYPTCLASNTKTCTSLQACFVSYFSCLAGVSNSRANTNNTACSTYGTNLYMAQLAAAAATTFNTTALSASCGYNLCLLANVTAGASACTASTVNAAVCTAANVLAAGTTTAAATTAAPTYDIVVTLTLSGSNWTAILNNVTLKAQCIASLTADIATFLGVPQSSIIIIALSIGSLIVNFGVLSGSGKSPSQLAASMNSASAGSIAWLSSTGSLYSTVGNDFKSVSATINSTGAPTSAPGGSTPAPTSSAMSAAGVFAVAAVAAVAALLA